MHKATMGWLGRAAAIAILFGAAADASPAPPLLQSPTLSADRIAFAYGGEIWTVPRAGGDATLLVGGQGTASAPVFSPDGNRIAYTANVNGNDDVFVVPAGGGQPTRLTWHPDHDAAVGWTPDGKGVLIRSHRHATNDSYQLYVMPMTGGLPTALPLSMAEQGSFSPDGSHIAYNPIGQWEPDWRDYHGGQTTRIWIARLSDSSIVKLPHANANDSDPMWMGDTVYFLSDRDGPATLYAYAVGSGKLTRLIDNHGFPIDGAAAADGTIVYSQMGVLHLYDVASGHDQRVPVRVDGPLPQTVPHFEKVAKQIQHAGISPTGARAVFEAHGEILTVPADKGDIRNITNTSNAAERDPAWSPDGKSIAYFSDAGGEYALTIRSQDGLGQPRRINLGQPPSFFYSPVWSPDGKRIAYSDKRLNLWYVDLEHPTPVKVDTDRFDTPLHEFDVSWSPDGRWLTYTKQLPNHLRAVFVYALATHQATQVTDGMSDCLYPVFDRNGKYLYYTASTDEGLSPGWLDMTSEAHPVTRSVYVAVLRKDLPSPLQPQSDEDKGPAAEDSHKNEGKPPAPDKSMVDIDFDGLAQRTLALPIEAANYVGMVAGKSGVLYLLQAPQVPGEDAASTLQRFELDQRKTDKLAEDVKQFALSDDGNKLLYQSGDDWFITDAGKPVKKGDGELKTGGMEVQVVPRQEWAQMYNEVWRIERDFFYDPHHHGLDLLAAEQRFRPYLAGVGSREDLNVLFRRMLAYMSVGHMFVRGGAMPEIAKIDVGLLGADYSVDHDRYRFSHVYSGENWNPDLHAPLTQPGVNVQAGEYLLAVNGQLLHAGDNLYGFFQQTVGKQVVLRVGPHADGSGARNVTVVPVKSEFGLRHLDWIEHNRREVDRLSDGQLAYVYLPDTAEGGFRNFNRYYFAQTDKHGALIDERYNHGGQLADYIVDALQRKPMSRVMTREGETYTEPTQAIYGPKAMLINQFSGSGGDALPWYFKRSEVGPLIGERTWGGLVGIGGYPPLLDGGRVTAPRWAIFGLHGQWEVENHGIAPDIEVWQDPELIRQGHDPQLEKAVEVLMQQLKAHPAPSYPDPAYPDYHPTMPPVEAGGG
ncbi:S41 family peptidase [Rhodanobacter sp. B05]|uniref:S41 family peptidase n=1 Tax=Rhodanobacter sp. B05 TaxID=1945859 RepID=UPI001C2BE3EA|nr:S41 family peptidase [Rhodanobacter sp. B05]